MNHNDIDRRTLLRLGGIAAVSALAGCQGQEQEADTDQEDADAEATTTTTAAPNEPPGADQLGGQDDLQLSATVEALSLDSDQGAGQMVYLADGEPTPGWDSVAEAEHFQRDFMGRSTQEIIDDRNAAVEFYRDRFGLDFPVVTDERNRFTVVDTQSGVDATLAPLYQDPGAGYTAYVVSGRAMPNHHGDPTTNTDDDLHAPKKRLEIITRIPQTAAPGSPRVFREPTMTAPSSSTPHSMGFGP